MKKTLIVSGCSFTFEPWNWPKYVSSEFDMNLINVAMACQGNGLISKKLIYSITELLKTKSADEIIAGIMWSGIDRHDIYLDISLPYPNVDNWIENPTSVTPDNPKWMIMSTGWQSSYSEIWYKQFHTSVGSLIYTLQNILMTQWFLERNNIKYFMTTYMDIFGKYPSSAMSDPDVVYLYNMIDFTKFLPVTGEYEWCLENYPDDGLPTKNTDYFDPHPTELGHEMFATQIINPHVKNIIQSYI